jgi:uncharacterized protein YkvS
MEAHKGKKEKVSKKIVLVDLDGVMANFESEILARFKERCPDKPFVPFEERDCFYVAENYQKLGYDYQTIQVFHKIKFACFSCQIRN